MHQKIADHFDTDCLIQVVEMEDFDEDFDNFHHKHRFRLNRIGTVLAFFLDVRVLTSYIK